MFVISFCVLPFVVDIYCGRTTFRGENIAPWGGESATGARVRYGLVDVMRGGSFLRITNRFQSQEEKDSGGGAEETIPRNDRFAHDDHGDDDPRRRSEEKTGMGLEM